MNEVKRYTADELKEILRLHADWLTGKEGSAGANLTGADLTGADLWGANLSGANLTGADLTGADLWGANLSGADLARADLTGADLSGADLARADLTGADLTGANLTGADLTGAYLSRACLAGADLTGADLTGAYLTGAYLAGANLDEQTTLWTGETWRAYLDTILPQLLTAGGKPLAEVAAAWECHGWDNCPMAVAFGINGTRDLSGLPLLLKPRIEQFVQLFDANLIPKPVVAEEAAV